MMLALWIFLIDVKVLHLHLDCTRRNTCYNSVCRHISHNSRTGTYHRIRSNMNIRYYIGSYPYKNASFKFDASSQVRTRANCTSITYNIIMSNGSRIIDDDMASNLGLT